MERGDGDGDGVRGVHGVSSQTTPDSSTAPLLSPLVIVTPYLVLPESEVDHRSVLEIASQPDGGRKRMKEKM